jgi:hypothetical protein
MVDRDTHCVVARQSVKRIGRPDTNRTCNPWFWRPVLCQLSYGPARPRNRTKKSVHKLIGPARSGSVRHSIALVLTECQSFYMQWYRRYAPTKRSDPLQSVRNSRHTRDGRGPAFGERRPLSSCCRYRVSRCGWCCLQRLQNLVNSRRSGSLRRFFSVV